MEYELLVRLCLWFSVTPPCFPPLAFWVALGILFIHLKASRVRQVRKYIDFEVTYLLQKTHTWRLVGFFAFLVYFTPCALRLFLVGLFYGLSLYFYVFLLIFCLSSMPSNFFTHWYLCCNVGQVIIFCLFIFIIFFNKALV